MIRKAEDKDKEQLADLFIQLHRYHINLKPEYFKMPNRFYFESEIEESMQNENKEIWLNEDGIINAFAIIKFINVERADRYPYKLCSIDIFGVKEGFGRKGIGGALINKIKERAREAGCRDLQLSFYTANTKAEKFYEKTGFIPNSIVSVQKL